MALAKEIEEWTRDKPSLVQIQSRARLNREMLMPSHTRAIKGLSHADKLRQQRSLEFLRHTSLLDAQKQLRGREQDLRNQQRALLKLLRRNLEARKAAAYSSSAGSARLLDSASEQRQVGSAEGY